MVTHPLRAYRESARLTQRELASLLNVTRTTVARWETGTRKVDQDSLQKIAEKTGIAPSLLRPDLAQILDGTSPQSEQSSLPAQA